MMDLNCQIEQRHFLYLSNRTVNALYLWFMNFQPFDIYGMVNILKVLHIWYSKHIESETMQQVLYFNLNRFFFPYDMVK